MRDAGASAHQAVDEPGLAANFGGDPAGGVGDEWKGKRKHQNPERGRRIEERSAIELEGRKEQDRNEDRAEADHDVIAEIEERDIVGPEILRKFVEAFHFRAPGAVGEKAERFWKHKRIIEALFFHVGLAENHERRAALGVEKAFHGGESNRLILGDHFALAVAGGKKLDERSDDADGDGDAEKKLAEFDVALREKIERADRSHGETARLHGADHRVRVLPEAPRIEEKLPKAAEREGAGAVDRVTDGMLHPRVGGDDEIAGKPRAKEHHERGEPVKLCADTFFAE